MSIVDREVERETPTGAALSHGTKDEPMEKEDSWDGCFVVVNDGNSPAESNECDW